MVGIISKHVVITGHSIKCQQAYRYCRSICTGKFFIERLNIMYSKVEVCLEPHSYTL